MLVETPIFWSPDAKSQPMGKDPDAGKDWRQEEKGTTEDEMVGWHHQFNGQEFEQTPGDSEGQGNLACCDPWSCKESDMIEWLNNNNMLVNFKFYLWLWRFPRVGYFKVYLFSDRSHLTKPYILFPFLSPQKFSFLRFSYRSEYDIVSKANHWFLPFLHQFKSLCTQSKNSSSSVIS